MDWSLAVAIGKDTDAATVEAFHLSHKTVAFAADIDENAVGGGRSEEWAYSWNFADELP